ncbi:MAG TPA: gliding motility-associated C-terminal domain-containing protein, partial [Roseivirga sp.]
SNPNAVNFTGIPTGGYAVYYVVSQPGFCGSVSNLITVNVNNAPDLQLAQGTQVCNDDLGELDFNSLTNVTGGTWIDNDNSGVDLTNLAAVSFNSIPAGVYNFTYTVPVKGPCGQITSSMEIQVYDAINAGNDSQVEICADLVNTLDLFSNLSTSANPNGVWNNLDNAAVDLSDPRNISLSNLAQGVYRFSYTVSQDVGPCTSKTSVLTLQLYRTPNPGKNGALIVCEDNEAINYNLFSALQGSPESGGTWTDLDQSGIDLSNPNEVNFNGLSTGRYRYQYSLSGQGGCNDKSAIVFVRINQAHSSGTDTSISVCNSNSGLNLFESLGGNPDPGGVWVEQSQSGIDLTDPTQVDFRGKPAGTYVFTYSFPASGNCNAVSSTLTVNLSDIVIAGESNSVSTCNQVGSANLNLFSGLGNNFIAGGTWRQIDNSNVNIADPTNVSFVGIPAGIYRFGYTINSTNSCQPAEAVLTVNVANQFSAGESREITLYKSSKLIDLNSFLVNADPGGSWTDLDNSGINLINSRKVSFNNVLANTYRFRYEITANGGCAASFAIITIKVLDEIQAGINTTVNLCSDQAKDLNLYSLLQGSASNIGTWNPVGFRIKKFNPQRVDLSNQKTGEYIFSYVVDDQNTARKSTLTIQLTASGNAGIGNISNILETCNTGSDVINLFDLLGGNPDMNGTWVEVIGPSEINDFDPTALEIRGLEPGNYEFQYEVSASGACTASRSQVYINVGQGANAGTNTTVKIDNRNSLIVNLFDLLDGQPKIGGVWYDFNGEPVTNFKAYDLSSLLTGTYDFNYVLNVNGICSGPASAILTIEKTIAPTPAERIKESEGISPNGDGINDFWQIANIEQFPRNSVKLFNRWGHLVFEMKSYNNTGRVFDGLANTGTIIGNKELPTGTYFYVIDFGEGSALKKGFLTLIR